MPEASEVFAVKWRDSKGRGVYIIETADVERNHRFIIFVHSSSKRLNSTIFAKKVLNVLFIELVFIEFILSRKKGKLVARNKIQ